MPPINTLQDISRALRENPEWREEIRRALLSAELLALPETHAALTESHAALTESHAALTAEVRELAVGMNALTARVDTLTARVDALTIRVDTLTARVDDLTIRLDTLTARVDDLTARVDALTARVDDLTAKVDALTTEVRAFVEATNRRLDSLEEGQRRLEKRMDGMQYRLDRLWGAGLEAQLPNKLPMLVRREFDVRRSHSVWADSRAGTGDRNPRFATDVADATDAGKISEDEHIRLMTTDLVMRARRNSDDATIWFAVEASGVINTDDIDRARQSADAIKKMYDEDAIPLVYGYRIPDHQRRQAREQGVRVFIDPDD